MKKLFQGMLCFLLLLCVPFAGAETALTHDELIAQAYAAMEAGDTLTAIALLKQASAMEDEISYADALTTLDNAFRHEEESEDQPDQDEGQDKNAAESGNAAGMAALGDVLREQGLTDRAVFCYEEAAGYGSVYAMEWLGTIHREQGDPDRAFFWYKKAAGYGSVLAMEWLGYLYRNLEPPDDRKAAEWYEKAAAQNSAYALYALGKMYEDGCFGQPDQDQARELYQQAVNLGSQYAWDRLMAMDGHVYEGVWKDGQRNGEGKITNDQGLTVEGLFENGEIKIIRKGITAEGHSFEGELDRDLSGRVKLSSADGIVFEGEAIHGMLSGTMEGSDAEGNRLTMEMRDNIPYGDIKIVYVNGNVYTGGFDWDHFVKSGYGKMIYAGVGVYEGEWKDDMPHGHGVYTWDNGNVFEGEWVEDHINGYGKLTYADGTVLEGKWANDQFVN